MTKLSSIYRGHSFSSCFVWQCWPFDNATEADSTISFLTFFVACMLDYMQSFWSRSRQSVSYSIMERNRHICVIESVIYYVDPKSPGSLRFLGSKERVRLPLHEEHCSREALKKHTVAHAGLKTEAKRRGSLIIELKLCRLAKTAEGSKAFSINTQAQWEVDRPLFRNSTVLQGLYYDLLLLTLQMPYLAVAARIIEETEYILSCTTKKNNQD